MYIGQFSLLDDFLCILVDAIYVGNISGANQPLRANYGNFNLDHQINIQGVWGLVNFTIWTCPEIGNHTFTNSPSHLSTFLPLNVDLIAQIEVSIVCTERLVCT